MSIIGGTQNLTGIYARIRGLSSDTMRSQITQQLQTQQQASPATPVVPAMQPQAAAKQTGVPSRMAPGFLSAELMQMLQEMQARAGAGQQSVKEEPAANASLSAYMAGPTADASYGLFHIDENNKVILTEAGKNMLDEVGDIGNYHSKDTIGLTTLTYYHTGEQLTGKDLAYALKRRDGSIRLHEIIAERTKAEAQQQPEAKPEPKVAVELDPKWIEAGRKIPVSNAYHFSQGVVMTSEEIYQERSPFTQRANELAAHIVHNMEQKDISPRDWQKQMFDDRIARGLKDFNDQMQQYDLTAEAPEYFDQYMQQKYASSLTLAGLYEQYGVA